MAAAAAGAGPGTRGQPRGARCCTARPSCQPAPGALWPARLRGVWGAAVRASRAAGCHHRPRYGEGGCHGTTIAGCCLASPISLLSRASNRSHPPAIPAGSHQLCGVCLQRLGHEPVPVHRGRPARGARHSRGGAAPPGKRRCCRPGCLGVVVGRDTCTRQLGHRLCLRVLLYCCTSHCHKQPCSPAPGGASDLHPAQLCDLRYNPRHRILTHTPQCPPLCTQDNKTGDVWHVALPRLDSSLLYGYRVFGANEEMHEESEGQRHDPVSEPAGSAQ